MLHKLSYQNWLYAKPIRSKLKMNYLLATILYNSFQCMLNLFNVKTPMFCLMCWFLFRFHDLCFIVRDFCCKGVAYCLIVFLWHYVLTSAHTFFGTPCWITDISFNSIFMNFLYHLYLVYSEYLFYCHSWYSSLKNTCFSSIWKCVDFSSPTVQHCLWVTRYQSSKHSSSLR